MQLELDEFKGENKQEHDRIFQALDNVRERLARVEAKLNGYSKGAS